MYNTNEQNQTINTIKQMLTGPLFLTAIIGYSVYGLFQFIGGFMGNSLSENLLYRMMQMQGGYGMDYGAFSYGYTMGYNFIKLVTILAGMIPVLLIVAGLWMLFISVKSNKQNRISTTGLTMIRVIVMIQLIGICILTVLAVIGIFFAMAFTGSDSVIVVVVIIMVLGIGIAAVSILYYLKLSATIKTMKNTILTGTPDNRISLYVVVICYIMGAGAILSALTSLVTLSLPGVLENAGLATANIAFAMYLMQYKRNMNCLMQNPNVLPIQQRGAQYQNPVQNPVQQGNSQYQTPGQPNYAQNQNTQYQAPGQPAPQSQIPQPQNAETTLLDYYNETSVLSGQMVGGGQLKVIRWTRQKTGELFCISKDSFWIGKGVGEVDYCITDNTAISRRHALVTLQDGCCFVRDNHSTNHTFLNGKLLPPDSDTMVSDGDRVRLADEEFIVSIE